MAPVIKRGVGVAPLNREHLDKAGPWLRLVAGLTLIAYTSYTTIAGVGLDFAPLLAGRPDLVVIAGVGVAVLLSVGEWLTSETAAVVYTLLLLIDARYTQRQIGPWIDALAQYHLAAAPWWAVSVVSYAVSWGMAIAAARYGEILLFGRRKRRE